MLLDALDEAQGGSTRRISFRRSLPRRRLRSDAMNINGKNGLACLTNMNHAAGRDRACNRCLGCR